VFHLVFRQSRGYAIEEAAVAASKAAPIGAYPTQILQELETFGVHLPRSVLDVPAGRRGSELDDNINHAIAGGNGAVRSEGLGARTAASRKPCDRHGNSKDLPKGDPK